jgi:hypothetical protein
MTYGAQQIADERQRQIVEEGYGFSHDQHHSWVDFKLAAVSYLLADIDPVRSKEYWPFEPQYYKPKSVERNMERSGAFVAAAIDRYADAACKGVNAEHAEIEATVNEK